MKRQINFKNYSMWTQKKYDYDWFDWCVFVNEDAEVIETIESVEYTLHPTFPNPIRVIKNKVDRFALFSAGWGPFLIKIRIFLMDGSVLNAEHDLELHKDNWPRKPAPKNFGDNDTDMVYSTLVHEKFRWRKFETIIGNTSLDDDRVLSILNRLEKDAFVRKASFRSVDNKELWGATAVVGISPKI